MQNAHDIDLNKIVCVSTNLKMRNMFVKMNIFQCVLISFPYIYCTVKLFGAANFWSTSFNVFGKF